MNELSQASSAETDAPRATPGTALGSVTSDAAGVTVPGSVTPGQSPAAPSPDPALTPGTPPVVAPQADNCFTCPDCGEKCNHCAKCQEARLGEPTFQERLQGLREQLAQEEEAGATVVKALSFPANEAELAAFVADASKESLRWLFRAGARLRELVNERWSNPG